MNMKLDMNLNMDMFMNLYMNRGMAMYDYLIIGEVGCHVRNHMYSYISTKLALPWN
jgi:hypothetical protein